MRGPRLLASIVAAQITGVLLADAGLAPTPTRLGSSLVLVALAAAGLRHRPSLAAGAVALAVAALAHGQTLERARLDGLLAHGEHTLDARLLERRSTSSGLRWVFRADEPGRPRQFVVFASRAAAEAWPLAEALPGERWRLRVRLAPVVGPANPGAPDHVRQNARRGIGATASLVDPRLAVRTRKSAFGGLQEGAARWRARSLERLQRHGEGGRLLSALALGERAGVGEIRRDFATLGVSHLLAISGLHLGMVVLLAYRVVCWIARWVACWGGERGGSWVAPAMARDGRKGALGLALIAGGGYAWVAGFGLPVGRALLFGLVGAAAFALRRPGPGRSGFWAAAAVLLALQPAAVFELGAQLSFAATAALLYSAPAGPTDRADEGGISGLSRGFGGYRRVDRIWSGGTQALRVSATALVATAPVLAAHGLVSAPVGLLANVALVPWTALVLLPGALLASGCAALGIWVGVEQSVAEIARWTLVGIHELAARLPETGARPAVAVSGLLVAWGMAAAALWQSSTFGRVGGALGAVLVLELGRASSASIGAGRLVALDVGSGDSLIVQTQGAAILVDGGLAMHGIVDFGRSRVLPALGALGIDRLDILIATHADADHVGGLVAVVEQLPVGVVWLPHGQLEDPGFRALRAAARARSVGVREVSAADAGVRFGPALRVEVLWPPRDARRLRRNDSSVVLVVTLGESRWLLTGDLGAAGELALLQSGQRLDAEVLKVGHHGSAGSSLGRWLDVVQPTAALLSAACNRPGLPSGSVLGRLEARSVALWWTARDGAVFVGADPPTIHSRAPGRGCR